MAITNTKKQKVRASRDEEDRITKKQKVRTSMEGRDEEDWLSSLPEVLLLNILSFIDTRSAVKTTLVSRAWSNLWRSLDTLRLDFLNSSFFAARFLRCLESSASHIRHLQFHHAPGCRLDQCPDHRSPIFARVLKFAADRNCRSFELGHVALVCHDISFFPNVTTCVSILSCLARDLSLINCSVHSSEKFEISCPKLVKLRIEHTFMYHYLCHLKCELVVSSPALTSLEILGHAPFPLTVGSDSLHRVSFSVNLCYQGDREIEGMMKMLHELRGVKHLELSTLVLKGLSNYPESLRKQTFGFHSLKSLKLRAIESYGDFKLPNDVLKFFLADSPSAKVTLPQ